MSDRDPGPTLVSTPAASDLPGETIVIEALTHTPESPPDSLDDLEERMSGHLPDPGDTTLSDMGYMARIPSGMWEYRDAPATVQMQQPPPPFEEPETPEEAADEAADIMTLPATPAAPEPIAAEPRNPLVLVAVFVAVVAGTVGVALAVL